MTKTLFATTRMLAALAIVSILYPSCQNQTPPTPPVKKEEIVRVEPDTIVTPPPVNSPPEQEERAENEGAEGQEVPVYKGMATYYSDNLQGRNTASGEPYDRVKYTAAVRMNAIPVSFGTIVEVYSEKSKKKVRVKVNDKMSDRASAIIDLSYQAAEEIGLIRDGRAKVSVRVVRGEVPGGTDE